MEKRSKNLHLEIGEVSRAVFNRWFIPRATERDQAFRERVIRTTVAILILLTLLSFLSTIFLFDSTWSLISFPTLHIGVLALCLAAAAEVHHGNLVRAGWLLIILSVLGASGLLILGRQQGNFAGIINVIPVFMFVPIISTLVLPRKYVILVSLISGILYAVFQFGFDIPSSGLPPLVPVQQITTVFLILLIEGVLLQRLRVEFDGRLEAMQESIQQTEMARARAEDADRAKSQFLANMSHELRTPLNAVIGYSEAMLGGMAGEFTAQQQKLLGHIQHNSRRLLALINDILDLSKIESGSVEIYMAPMSPRKVIQDTIESLRSLAQEKEIELQVAFDQGMPELILGDAVKIQQIMVNLAGNAIKFTDKGSVMIDVRAVDKNWWQLAVHDTGIGIPADATAYIFDPFQQVDGTNTRRHKGTGLGLSITKRLVEMMDGTIEVHSEPGKGSTFTINLPRVHSAETSQPT